MVAYKRFLVFASYDYYPAGGFNDFEDDFDTMDEAKCLVEKLKIEKDYDRLDIVDLQNKKEFH